MTRYLLLGLLLGLAALPATWSRAQEADHGSLQALIDAAQPGGEVYVDGGVYRESVRIDKPLALIGSGWPVIDGGEEGVPLTIAADDVSVSGFVIRNSSRTISQEPAAVKADGVDRVRLRGNRIEDSLYGIHITGSSGDVIENNLIDLGREVPIERRGHAIYLWQVRDTVVHGNTIRYAADAIHLEFSQGNGIGQNTATHSRYALHFMYSDGNTILGNHFRENLAGAVLMYSNELVIKENDLSENRRGATGTGILFKDCNNVFVEGNRILRNKYGITVDGTPQARDATAVFMRNLFALNDTGVGAMSNSAITFVENAMVDNTVQVKALGGDLAALAHGGAHSGGGQPEAAPAAAPVAAAWTVDGRGNYWSDYNGYDANGDGVGDRPYEPRPPMAGALGRDETLRLFNFTLAQQAIDMAAKMFPVYRYKPVIVDSGPLMSPPGPALPASASINGGLLAVSALLVLLAVAVLQSAGGLDVGAALRRIASAPARRAGG